MTYLLGITLDIAGKAIDQKVPGSANLTTADAGFGALVSGLLSMTMSLGAILLLGYLIWGGVEWITSGGDKGKTESARNKIPAAITGLLVLAASIAVVTMVQGFLGLCFLNFGTNCS